MDKFIINGGRPLAGEIEVRGSKNAATPILAACLLTEEPCEIDNLPLIEDVFRIIEILKSMGVEIEWTGQRKIKVQAKNINPGQIDQHKVCQLRSSILIIGGLLGRFDDFKIGHPGGCIIGSRPVETHFEALIKLGINVSEENNFYQIKKNDSQDSVSRKIVLKEFSVTATENVLMASVLRPGKTILRIAAAEPHVKELAVFLNKMGARISGVGAHEIEI
ncbi:MAG: UDP-N-acetylglucosamine 1-carboxyvinyltransferase, partial [Parcubacteria group bacterium GW2011_GWA1_42_7]